MAYELKLARAKAHLDELQSVVTQWIGSNHHRSAIEPDPQDSYYSLLKAWADPVPTDPFSLLIGDVVQNFRHCLDHIAFELASAFTKPLTDKLAEDSQFPIVGDISRKGTSGTGETQFQSALHSIAGMDPKAQAVIKGLQPYQWGANFHGHPLWKLRTLTNIDKHRVLLLSAAFSGGMAIEVITAVTKIAPGDMQVFGATTIEAGTVIARIPLAKDYSEVDMPIKPAIYVGFAEGPLATQDVCDTLGEIYKHILTKVIPDLKAFL